MTGKVTLVGAGPGDKGLITVKGMEELLGAEVVVYDRLVGDEILSMMPDSAEKIDAGKASSAHKIPQNEINRILLTKALEGKRVVRLKGGDCYLFGRGGEEIELLYKNNIPFEVVPGVTSALAAPAYAGIPITHREFASSVHIITGHAKAGRELSIDFEAYRKTGGTLVFLMGVANMEYIIGGLLNAGFNSETPCAVVERGTTWGQKKYVGVLSDITEKAKAAKSPAIIIVGDVCSLSDKYDWFSRQPLFGVSVAVTRPKERQGTLSEKLRKKGARVSECPCIKTKNLMTAELAAEIAKMLKNYDWAVFTSPMGVRSVMESLFQSGLDARVFGNVKIAAIGSATAAELRCSGLAADVVPETYDGAGLGEALKVNAEKNDRLLLLRAKVSNKTLNTMLDEAGLEYTELAVYETEEYCERSIADESVDYVTFTSASTVRGFAAAHKNLKGFKAVCIGKTTAAEAEKYGYDCIVSPAADIDSLIKTIEKDRV